MKNKKIIIMLLSALFVLSLGLDARPKETSIKDKNDEMQRSALGLYDLQKNTVSNIDFYTTNYGIFGLDVARNRGGGYWPRGSQNQYIFAGGVWFGAVKQKPGDTAFRKYVEITYNPNSGTSWMVPGRMDANGSSSNDLADQTLITKYRTYFSTDFNRGTGEPLLSSDGENWPIWDTQEKDTIKRNRYFGYYNDDETSRNRSTYSKGPAFISAEDIFATFKDTDLSRYDGGAGKRKNDGYPLRLQFEHTIYSWGFGDYKDFIFLRYDIINFSKDTLKECWMAPVMDIDIAIAQNSQGGASNDRCRYYDEDPSLNLAVQWTQGDQGEKGQGFGYLGFDFLESPAVYNTQWKKIKQTTNNNVTTYEIKEYMCLEEKDTLIAIKDTNGVKIGEKDSTICSRDTLVKSSQMVLTVNGGKTDTLITNFVDITNYTRKDRKYYENKDQLGLKTFRNWPIAEDKNGDDERYNFMSSRLRDGDLGAGDKRFMMATGPFNMRPTDTVRVIVGMILANPSVKQDADGTTPDLVDLITKDKFAQRVYDENFRAPIAPDRAFLKWAPMNNAIKIWWDSTSEVSSDEYEQGLAFMGYRLYRARRTNLDTFSTSNVGPTSAYPSGTGPFGWKQVATWTIPTPFLKSVNRGGKGNDPKFPFIDSLRIVGPSFDNQNVIDSFAIKVIRVGRGIKLVKDSILKAWNIYGSTPAYAGSYFPAVIMVDTGIVDDPWGKYFASVIPKDKNWPMLSTWISYHPFFPNQNHSYLMDSILLGTILLDRAQLKYNPLFTQVQTINVSPLDTPLIPARIGDTVYLKNTYRKAVINGTVTLLIDRLIPLKISDCMKDTNKIKMVLDSVYSYIKRGIAKAIFPKFEQTKQAREQVIIPFMAKLTNNRSFMDIGDDNGDGQVLSNADPTKTEKLLNNVDYYYKLLSYDEGDFNQPTENKLNDAGNGLPNFVLTHPAPPPAGNKATFEVTYIDSAKIGGLYNFQFFPVNQDRINQLFAGHEFELEFNPYWNLTNLALGDKRYSFGMYYRDMKLTDLTTKEVLFNARTVFEETPCRWSYEGGFTENASSYFFSDSIINNPNHPADSITFGMTEDTGIIERSGSFNSGDFTQSGYCYAFGFQPPAEGAMGFTFDYKLQQHGGHLRPDSTSKRSDPTRTPVFPRTDTTQGIINTTFVNGYNVYGEAPIYGPPGATGKTFEFANYSYGSFNNGPGDYIVTFKEGGTEDMTLTFGSPVKTNTFKVNYLTMELVNTKKYYRPGNNNDSVKVEYPGLIQHIVIPTIDTIKAYPDPTVFGLKSDTMINKYNLHSFGWVNSRRVKPFNLLKTRAKMADFKGASDAKTSIGTQGRYYLTAISVDGKDTLDFTNQIIISGCRFVFDFANTNRAESDNKAYVRGWLNNEFPIDPNLYTYGTDFKVGDTISLKVSGGAYGLPLPGAKVRFKVSPSKPENNNYTDQHLNQVTVVPNPYYISHQMQKSPYDSKLFFTKLPPVCTISIYTATGDLVRTIEHNETVAGADGPDKHAVDVWDLLSSNKQRVQSQTLVALIKTPNGAESVVQFTVVVGGFRLIQTD